MADRENPGSGKIAFPIPDVRIAALSSEVAKVFDYH
jgi:hypothetical protein